MEITELALCPECNNSLFSDSLKALTLLECGYVYHRVCIENRFLLSSSNYVCLFPDRGKNVESINRPEELTPQTPQEEGY